MSAIVAGSSVSSTSPWSSSTLLGPPGKVEIQQLAHDTTATLATDEESRTQDPAVRQLDGHRVPVVAQREYLAAAPDLGTNHKRMLGQQVIRPARPRPLDTGVLDARVRVVRPSGTTSSASRGSCRHGQGVSNSLCCVIDEKDLVKLKFLIKSHEVKASADQRPL